MNTANLLKFVANFLNFSSSGKIEYGSEQTPDLAYDLKPSAHDSPLVTIFYSGEPTPLSRKKENKKKGWCQSLDVHT